MGALDGLRVLDFSRVLAGPLATMVLADLGADVIKVERPLVGDDTRQWGPPYDADGTGVYFHSVNRNKRSIALDLVDPRDRDRAARLAQGCDIIVENFRSGTLEKYGLDFASLSKTNPGLVYCSITGFGSGAGAGLAGYDLLIQAVGGLMSITGEADGSPQKTGVAVVDVMAGLFACTGILAAVEHRRRTGEGQLVEINLLSSLLAGLVNQSTSYTMAGLVPRRQGNAHHSIAPYESLPTSDGDLVVAVGNEGQFASLCEVLGRADLMADPRFASNGSRVENRVALREALSEALCTETVEDMTQRLTAVGVPAGPINDLRGAFALAERLGLQPSVTIDGADGSQVSLPRNPIGLSRTPVTYHSGAPLLPSHETETEWKK